MKNKKERKNKINKGLFITVIAATFLLIALGLVYAHNENTNEKSMMGMMHNMHTHDMQHDMYDLHEDMTDMKEHMKEHGFTEEEIQEHLQEMKEHCPMM